MQLTVTGQDGKQHTVLFDVGDYALVRQYEWRIVTSRSKYSYVWGRRFISHGYEYVYLHKLLLGSPGHTSFLDRNPLNCTRANLQLGSRNKKRTHKQEQSK